MNRQEFETLRDLPDKTIEVDIAFMSHPSTGPNLIFSDVPVKNSMNLDVVLNGTFKPLIPSVTFNFVLRGVGPICRLCVNGTKHGAAGRTHKHDLNSDSDPRLNLPEAIARPDLDGLSPGEVWNTLLANASIKHTGTFVDPQQGANS